MKRPTFLEGVAVALVASVSASVGYALLTSTFGADHVLRLLIAALACGYLLYLFSRSHARSGRVTTLTAWTIAAAVLWFLQPSLVFYLLIHIGMIWLIRSLYFYSSVLASLADFGLSGLALLAAVWAASHTASLFLAVWCFFLVQALFGTIPASPKHRTGPQHSATPAEDRFQQAHRVAEAALRQLASIR